MDSRRAVKRLCVCLNIVTSTSLSSVYTGASVNLELVDKFCCLGDILSVNGYADAAMGTRIQIRWNKFRQLMPLFTNKV